MRPIKVCADMHESLLQRTQPSYQRELFYQEQQREADARFIRAMALAFQRGDHLPQMGPLRLPER
jgi:hypothetical protein